MSGTSPADASPVTVRVVEGVACVTIDHPPVNALSTAVRRGLLEAVGRAAADPEVGAAVIACAGRTFVAGADIREFGRPPEPPSLPQVIDAIEGCAKPVVAAIHGSALGGGLELAMACHARVATPDARLGLPETRLGLIPGATGTQRLPRLVGLERALAMMWSGEPIDAPAAQAAGLVDLVAEPLPEAAMRHAAGLIGRPPRRVRELPLHGDAGELEAWRQRAGEHPSGPQVATALIEVLQAGLQRPWEEAVAIEREAFLRLRASPEAAALRYLFFAERAVLRAERAREAADPASPWLAAREPAPPLRSEHARRALARLAGRYLAEAQALVAQRRASATDIDAAMRAWGCPVGPLQALEHLPEALRPVPPALAGAAGGPLAAAEIRERLLDAVVLEAALALAERALATGAEADVLMAAAGWLPRYRGGAVYAADAEGLETVARRVAARRAAEGQERWPRAPLLERVAAAGGRLAETGTEEDTGR